MDVVGYLCLKRSCGGVQEMFWAEFIAAWSSEAM